MGTQRRLAFAALFGAVLTAFAKRPAALDQQDRREIRSEGDDHPTPEMVEAIFGPAQDTFDMQLSSFRRAEDSALQLLAGGSIVVGLASLSDLSQISRPAEGFLVGAVAAYVLLFAMVLCQLVDRRRRVPRGDRALTSTEGRTPTEARAAWILALNQCYELNNPRVERKGRYLTVAVVALALESALVGAVIITTALTGETTTPPQRTAAPVTQTVGHQTR